MQQSPKPTPYKGHPKGSIPLIPKGHPLLQGKVGASTGGASQCLSWLLEEQWGCRGLLRAVMSPWGGLGPVGTCGTLPSVGAQASFAAAIA